MNIFKFNKNNRDDIESRLKDTPYSAFISEMLTNSGHFLLLNSIAEITGMGLHNYIINPSHYLMLIGMLIQGWYLSRPSSNRFFGNLIGFFIYTLTDFPLDGLVEFFEEFNHWVLFIFSLLIAILQGLRTHWIPSTKNIVIPLESITRMTMLLTLYFSFQLKINTTDKELSHLVLLLPNSPQHWFILASILLVGLFLGLQTLQVTKQKESLQKTARILKDLAQWGMGNHAVKMAITNQQKLFFERRKRAILFMDIRGFTNWCEKNSPDQVAHLLNAYYQAVEPSLATFKPLKVSLTADEVMAIYSTPEIAVKAAQNMQEKAILLLDKYNLGAGCAVHYGSVVEGFFGTDEVRTYTVLGDIVNTAKRLESSTPAGEITISDSVYEAIENILDQLTVTPRQPLTVKGKSESLKTWKIN
jgi:adenylate cyclase